ncbi:MAG: hypothetical protein RR541_02360 [Carnobacterium sp.]
MKNAIALRFDGDTGRVDSERSFTMRSGGDGIMSIYDQHMHTYFSPDSSKTNNRTNRDD